MAEIGIQELQSIIASAPNWVKESTLQSITQSSDTAFQRNLTKLNKLSKTFGFDPIMVSVKEQIKQKRKQLRKTRQVRKNVMSSVDVLIRGGGNPITGMANAISTMGTVGAGGLKAIGKGISAVDKVTGKNPYTSAIVKGVDKVAGGGLKAAKALTGFTAASGAIIMTLEKDYRAMIEVGAVGVGDQIESFRDNVADTGMSLVEATQQIAKSQGMFASLGDNILGGADKFYKFTAEIERMNMAGKGGISDFGYSSQKLAERMREEAEYLYELNDLRDSDLQVKGRVYKNFEQVETILGGMAAYTGQRKSELLAQGDAVVKDANFQHSMTQNKEYIEEKYGEGASNQIRANVRFTTAALASTPTLQKMYNEAIANYAQDFRVNGENAVLSFQSDAYEKLMVADPELAKKMVSLVKDTFSTRMEGVDAPVAVREIQKYTRDIDVRSAPDEMSKKVNELIAEANVVPNLDQPISDFIKGVENTKKAAEGADDIQDGLDDVSKGFRNTYAKMTPALKVTGEMFDTLSSSVSEFGKAMGFDFDLNEIEEYYQKRDERNKEAEENLNDAIEAYGKNLEKATPARKQQIIDTYKRTLEGANLTGTLSKEFADAERSRIDSLTAKRFAGFKTDAISDSKTVEAGGMPAPVMDSKPFETTHGVGSMINDSWIENSWDGLMNWLFGPEEPEPKFVPKDVDTKSIPLDKNRKPITITSSNEVEVKAKQMIETYKELKTEYETSVGTKKWEAKAKYESMVKEMIQIMKGVNTTVIKENLKEVISDGR